MKICTYKRQTPLGEFHRLGLYFNETTIIDVNLLWQSQFEKDGFYNAKSKALDIAPSSLSAILSNYQDASISFFLESIDLFKDLSKEGILKTSDGGDLSFDLRDDKDVKLGCPIDKINCYRDFYVHEKHVAKGFEKRGEPIPEAWYEIPAYYKGPTTGFIGTDEFIPWPNYTKKLDYELEFGLIIGKDGKNIKAENAMDHIFGYTVFNDISAYSEKRNGNSTWTGEGKRLLLNRRASYSYCR
jgi:2-keto-4-pentenoate hydratase/2-oxohepta-3-ene-1,7-dioic acid hydratase in catechol pathway